MGSITISQAMKAIKAERCCECGRRAEGFVYRGHAVSYYCKKCLHEYTSHRDAQAREDAAG